MSTSELFTSLKLEKLQSTLREGVKENRNLTEFREQNKRSCRLMASRGHWMSSGKLNLKYLFKIKFQHVTDVPSQDRKQASHLLIIHTPPQDRSNDEGLSSGKTLFYINASATPNCE